MRSFCATVYNMRFIGGVVVFTFARSELVRWSLEATSQGNGHSHWTCFETNHSNYSVINHFTPKDRYSGCTAPLTSKRCILYIYSTNTGTEYFKHGIY